MKLFIAFTVAILAVVALAFAASRNAGESVAEKCVPLFEQYKKTGERYLLSAYVKCATEETERQ